MPKAEAVFELTDLVGRFDEVGLYVSGCWDGGRRYSFGLAASRKSSEP